jgi:hypothetical protein
MLKIVSFQSSIHPRTGSFGLDDVTGGRRHPATGEWRGPTQTEVHSRGFRNQARSTYADRTLLCGEPKGAVLRRASFMGLVALLCAIAASVGVSSASATVNVCANWVSMTGSAGTVTATFDVYSNGCQVSLMGISYEGGPTNVVDQATGTFSVGRHQLQVQLPCGTNTEADLILGPPALFPAPPADLLAKHFFFPCQGGAQTRTQGYWKNHASAWPVQSVTLGGVSFTKTQAIALLNTPVQGNATLILDYQLIAATLNVAAGTNASCISSTIAAANAWLASHGGAAGFVSASSAAGQTAVTLGATLDSYNNGKLCAPGG